MSEKVRLLANSRIGKSCFLPGVLGFLSIYIVWITWSHLFGWGREVSFTYLYGDHLVLPLFNAIAFTLIAKKRGPLSLWAAALVIPTGLFLAFFEPDASEFRQSVHIDWWLRGYHSGFIFLEFSFVVFMLGVYPFLGPTTYAPLPLTTLLFLLIGCFLALVFVADDPAGKFPPWIKVTTGGILLTNYGVLVVDRKFEVINRLKRKVVFWAGAQQGRRRPTGRLEGQPGR